MARSEIILDGLDLRGRGLEIGGRHEPVVAASSGVEVATLDQFTEAELRARCARNGLPHDNIRPVDHVWSGQTLAEAVGGTRFDWIVASHAVSDAPDLIGFINQCAEILTAGGTLSLAIPDRRYTFDYYRPVSSMGAIIDAHLAGRTVSSPGAVAEHFLYFSQLAGEGSWSGDSTGQPDFTLDADVARERLRQARSGESLNVHAWVFTPHSFRLLIHDLCSLGLLQLREHRFNPTAGCEFFLQLTRRGAGPGMDRLSLAASAAAEQAPLPRSKLRPADAPASDPSVNDFSRYPTLPANLLRNALVLPDRHDALPLWPKDAVIVEVGVAFGGFSDRILKICRPRKFIAIDRFDLHELETIWGESTKNLFGGRTQRDAYAHRFANYIDRGVIEIIQGDSDPSIRSLPDNSVDVFYVDADHMYEGVRADLDALLPKVKPDGWIIMNDYVPADTFSHQPLGVIKATNEFMIAHGWEMAYFALAPVMYCDVGLRRLGVAGKRGSVESP